MQFQKRGKIIRVLAYRGYDADKKRAKVVMIGSLSNDDLVPNDKLLANMTDKEKLELAHYIEKEQLDRQQQLIRYKVQNLSDNIGVATQAIRDNVYSIHEDEAQTLFTAMDSLVKQLKISGFVRVKLIR